MASSPHEMEMISFKLIFHCSKRYGNLLTPTLIHYILEYLETKKKSVILLKEQDENFANALKNGGYTPYFLPVLDYLFINQEELKEALSEIDRFSGIIVTSPRASQAIVQCFSSEKIYKILKRTKIYSVGRATSAPLRQLGLICYGEDCGSASCLSEYLEEHHNCKEKSLLHVCGEKRRDALRLGAIKNNQLFSELEVYKTKVIPQNEPPQECGIPLWIIFFSPSGIQAIQGSSSWPWNCTNIGAIGKTTASALEKQNYFVSIVPSQPTSESLVEEMQQYDNHETRNQFIKLTNK